MCILLVLITQLYITLQGSNNVQQTSYSWWPVTSMNDAELFYQQIFMIMVGYGTITIQIQSRNKWSRWDNIVTFQKNNIA
jgi:hypothetical protein